MASRTAPEFDPETVGGLAVSLAKKIKEVSELRNAYEEAERLLRHAETELSNLRSAFTRSVDGHLKVEDLKQKAPEMHRMMDTP